MQSSEEIPDDAVRDALAHRIMQQALTRDLKEGISPLHVARFQSVGLMRRVKAPEMPAEMPDVVRNKVHPQRLGSADGPLVFIAEQNSISIVEIIPLLLHPDYGIRAAAMAHLRESHDSTRPWLTQHSRHALDDEVGHIESTDDEEWRSAALRLVPLLSNDYLQVLAALSQSLESRYEEGIKQYLEEALRPGWSELFYLRPPLLNPVEQRDELQQWMSDLANRPTIGEALTEYVMKCGYIPLSDPYSASALFDAWQSLHKESAVEAKELWEWAHTFSPVGVYHVVTIALSNPALLSDSAALCLAESAKILETGVGYGEDTKSSNWDMHCALASHFIRHLEAIHPGQDGNRVACMAWWLAFQLTTVLEGGDVRVDAVLQQVVRPQASLSRLRWTAARSPVSPSSLRYLTLTGCDVWSLSWITAFAKASSDAAVVRTFDAMMGKIAEVIHRCVITSVLGHKMARASLFAYEESDKVADLCALPALFDGDNQRGLAAILRAREVTTKNDLDLHGLSDSSPEGQYFTLLFLRDAVFTTTDYDASLAEWLSNTSEVIATLLSLPERELYMLMETLSEVQQRPGTEWSLRVPHIVAWAIEQSNDVERVHDLFGWLVQMSVGVGIVSPIQRALGSNKRALLVDPITTWRENITFVAQYSEPWVAGRVRAASAAVSRIVGPRSKD